MASSSSPAGLPSSSIPNPTPSSPTGSRQPQRPATNALSLEDDEPEAEEEEGAAGGRKRRRPRTQGTDVPLVKDAVGESVVEDFEKFLKT